MKIAILTQPLNINFGGTLQAYALQKTLRDLEVDVETINYQMKQSSDLRKIVSTLKQKIIHNKNVFHFFSKEFVQIQEKHKKFIESNLKYSKPIFTSVELEQYFQVQNFDAVVVGSDQVWRVVYSPKIENFFLDFLKNNSSIKKIAYAASFGITEWQFSAVQTAELKELIQKFDYISVREDSAVSLCKEYLNIEAEHVLDPTMLLSKESYLELCESLTSKNENQGKIFTYVLDDTFEKTQIIEYISYKLKRKTFKNQPIKSQKESFIVNSLEPYIYPSIESWIKSFHEADFIITDSFHGTVFSIIFNKPFISIVNKERGASRFISLLRIFNLESRLVTNLSELEDKIITDIIDFTKVNFKLDELRIQSSNQLKYKIFFN